MYLYERISGNQWGEPIKVRASDANTQQQFGFKLAWAGESLIVGAPFDGEAASRAGAVYVFSRNAQGQWVQDQKIHLPNAGSGDAFGGSLAANGNRFVVGAPRRRVNGSRGSGAAYVYVRDGKVWRQDAELSPSEPTPAGVFGSSVTIDRDSVLVSAPGYRVGDKIQGRVFSYEWNEDAGWVSKGAIDPIGDNAEAGFGTEVKISSNRAVMSRYDPGPESSGVGLVRVYQRKSRQEPWTPAFNLTSSPNFEARGFGLELDLFGDRVVVGVPSAEFTPVILAPGAMQTFKVPQSFAAPLVPWWMLVGLGSALAV